MPAWAVPNIACNISLRQFVADNQPHFFRIVTIESFHFPEACRHDDFHAEAEVTYVSAHQRPFGPQAFAPVSKARRRSGQAQQKIACRV
jgi:hypothetical protein